MKHFYLTIALWGLVFTLQPVYGEAAGWFERSEERRPVASVNGVELMQADFNRLFARARQESPQGDEAALNTLRSTVLDSMIDRELLLQASAEADITIDEEELEHQIDSLRAGFESNEAFEARLQEIDVDYEILRSDIEQSLIVQAYIEQEILPTISVNEAEERAFYDENGNLFEQQQQVGARHILVSTQQEDSEELRKDALERVNTIRDDLLAGADFDRLAREFSEGPSASRGGDLGLFGRGQMVAPFEDAAFSLDVGAISEIVETIFGYHIIQVTQRVEAATMPFEEVKPTINNHLLEQRIDGAVEAQVGELREQATIDIHLDR